MKIVYEKYISDSKLLIFTGIKETQTAGSIH